MKNFIVKHSNIQGKGVYANKKFKKGEIICVFRGSTLTIPKLKKKYESGEEKSTDPLQISDALYLDLQKPYVFFNHSCAPNAYVGDKFTLFALKDIGIGKEITYDYSLTDFPNYKLWGKKYKEPWTMKCHCGFSSCRKTITEFKFLPQRVWKLHFIKGTLQEYIIRKIKRVYKINRPKYH